jgi:cytochrome c peroxidase
MSALSLLLAVQLLAQPIATQATPAEIALGRELFFDPILSVDGTVACATCHVPQLGWSDGASVSTGIRGQKGIRNAPTVVNAIFSPLMFWDGRTVGLTTQSLLPLVNPIEMGNRSEQQVVDRLDRNDKYRIMFTQTYGVDVSTGKSVTAPRLAKAIASFESKVTSLDAPIDRYLAGNQNALSEDAKIGYNIFRKLNCQQCHPAPLYTDYALHNNGMEFASKVRVTDNGRFDDLAKKNRQTKATDVRAFKTPTLRNLKFSAPYNHAGTYATIRRCVMHYNLGGVKPGGTTPDRFMDTRIKPLGLTDSQVDYVVIFLDEGLTGIDYPLMEN